MPTDKGIESAHFKSFRHFAGDSVPDGPVTHSGAFGGRAPDGAPDFLIATPGNVLGVELRELLKEEGANSERAEEGFMHDLLQIAQEFTELRSTARPRVSVFSYGGTPRDRPGRRDLARKLSNIVSSYMPEDRGHADIDSNVLRAEGIRSVDRIMIHRDDRLYRSGIWVAPQAGVVLGDCLDLLQRAIDDKAAKYHAYRRHCDECWLVLVADSFKPSGTIHPNERSLAHEYGSPFERTYFLDYGMGQLHALRTMPSE